MCSASGKGAVETPRVDELEGVEAYGREAQTSLPFAVGSPLSPKVTDEDLILGAPRRYAVALEIEAERPTD